MPGKILICFLINGELSQLCSCFIADTAEAVKPFVRDEVYRGIKQPFLAPPTLTSPGNPMYELLEDTLRGTSLKSVPFFDRAAVVRFLDELPTMEETARSSMDPVLFMMALIGILHTHYKL